MRLGDLDALKEYFKSRLLDCNEWIVKAKDKETKIRASAVKAFIGEVIMTINNATTVDNPYQEGYIDGVLQAEKLYAKPLDEWIPVSERLPEKKGYFLTSTVFNDVYCDFWNGYEFERTEMILAWMPLPEPYKKEGDEE